MHRNIRVGVDALHLKADKVPRQGRETGFSLGKLLALL